VSDAPRLQLVASNPSDGPNDGPRRGPRILTPGAPPSPGQLPNELAAHLQRGEVLVWWGTKDRIQTGPLWMVFGAIVAVLGFASLFAPEFWVQPWRDLAQPIAALASPLVVVFIRERINQRSVLVTDAGIVEVDRDGSSERLHWGTPVAVRRDVIRGGLVLRGPRAQVRVPPTLVEDARQAVLAAARDRVRGAAVIDDPTGWLA
jgi:hypothetical protein